MSLIGKNLKYFALNYQTDLTEEEKLFVYDWAEGEMGDKTDENLVKEESEQHLVLGQLIDNYLFETLINKEELNKSYQQNNRFNGFPEWKFGYIVKHKDSDGKINLTFQTMLNSLLAGALVK